MSFLLDVRIAHIIGVVLQWGFLMAFLYSLVSSINSHFKALVILSSIMAISYFPGVLFNYQTITYLDLAILDAITIVVLIIAQYFYIKEKTVAFMYLMLGLSINMCFALGMYLDSYILHNYTYWWFWGLYSSVVAISDLSMILVLFINRDFLKIIYLKNLIYSFFAKKPQ
ncbi:MULTISPECIES: hypothetical protein [Pseudoalteromonas]|nr:MULTISPECIES: hypothetical protein [Pseudoalteromonas]MDC9565078.1 hypothetical protein [Pseudoalteromonas sp. GAB2316C]MDC9569479.1 hypothetical protein [Pseudoalteromonas sp. GABNB9D]MDC9577992.1 hypothetical protein [Pseudoalteromonas sp. GABNS16E]MDC9585645.1 hypothetical protein [Pseudoalteromonas sp. GABNS16C]MDC9600993.1 hypothetical protein [Pseudoalteromonas sp. GABNS16G]